MSAPVMTEADHERGLALINRLMPTIVAGWEAMDDVNLAHEAERLEGLESTPLIKSMRANVASLRAAREQKAVTNRG
jgi:prophage DNA circulation protein